MVERIDLGSHAALGGGIRSKLDRDEIRDKERIQSSSGAASVLEVNHKWCRGEVNG